MIFCVEDDDNIRELVIYTLETTGLKARGFADGAAFMEALAFDTPELILLDIMLPGDDGLELLKKLKSSSKTRGIPVIMVTAKGSEYDKVVGLDSGADDYVTKPFGMMELVARIKAQLRRYKRYNTSAPAQDLIELGGLVINTATHQCTLDERPLSLTPTEFSILVILCQNRGKVISAEELFHQLWKDEYYTKSNNSISVHIRHLREKMGDCFESPKYIKTVWGVGYRIEDSTISHP